MKILCVIDSLGSGGAQRQMSLLALGLKARGHDVQLFLYQPNQTHFRQSIEHANIPLHEIPRHGRKGFSLRVLWRLIKLFSNGYDAAISFQPTANFYSAAARLTAPSVRLVAGERTSTATHAGFTRRLTSWFAGVMSNRVVANSESNAAYLRRLPGLSGKVHAIWNGYEVVAPPAGKTRSSRGFETLLVVARVSPEKNGLRLLEALDIFFRRHGWMPNVFWAGRRDGSPACLLVQQEMDRFLADKPDIAERWTWLGEVKNVPELYATSDALILPSLYEGLPNAVCEAMLAGCPVVASDVCDHPQLLGKDGERGFLCNPLAAESICAALERMNDLGPQGREEMATRARDFALENLSLDRMVESYEKMISPA